MTKEEILEYIFLCISYKHNNDISPYITKSACEKENLLFENAIEFLDKLEKEIAELKAKVTALENANKAMVKELDDMTSGGISFLTNVVRSKEEIDKAKEHIENLLYYVKQCTCERSNYAEIENDIKEAEQFLKEVSE